jgi:hypothetical protein
MGDSSRYLGWGGLLVRFPFPREPGARSARDAKRAEAELEKARRVIEVQGNVSALLEELLQAGSATEDGSSER